MGKPKGAMGTPYGNSQFSTQVAQAIGAKTIGTQRIEEPKQEEQQKVIPEPISEDKTVKIPFNEAVKNFFITTVASNDNSFMLNEVSNEKLVFSNGAETYQLIRTK